MKEGELLCRCWAMDIRPDDPESFLSGLRAESPGVLIQVFSGRRPRAAVVEMIAAQTLTAARSGSMLADRAELDLLLRLAGTRQIGDAFRLLGYKARRRKLFLVAASGADGKDMERLLRRLANDSRFVEIPKSPLTEEDLELVERAALLAAKP